FTSAILEMTATLKFVLILASLGWGGAVHPQSRLESCPVGYDLDESIEKCVFTDTVDCTNYEILRCPMVDSLNEYCMCKDLHLQIYSCAEGTYFDVTHNVCKLGSIECQDEYFTPSTCPNDASPDAYCLCINGKYVTKNCPAGYNYNDVFKFCLKADGNDNADPGTGSGGGEVTTEVPKSGQCQRSGMFGDPLDCSGYYFCTDKGAEIQYSKCQGGKIFSLTAFSCVDGSC
ncbi:hypothetical protein KR009_007145, partial [Drosophila setifemur]